MPTHRVTRSIWWMFAVTVLALTFTACESTTKGSDGSVPPRSSASSPATSTTPSAPSSPPLTASLPIETASAGSPTAKGQTLIGTLYQGAEPGCIGLRVGTTSYELTGQPVSSLPSAALDESGRRVRVVGHLAAPTLASHCMLGRIFEVASLTSL